MDDQQRRAAWRMYFLTVAGWSFHPGHRRTHDQEHALVQAKRMADEMLRIEEEAWRTGP